MKQHSMHLLAQVGTNSSAAEKQAAADDVTRALKALIAFAQHTATDKGSPVTINLGDGGPRTIDSAVVFIHSANDDSRAVTSFAVNISGEHLGEYGPSFDEFVQKLTGGQLEVWPFPAKCRQLVRAFRDKLAQTLDAGIDNPVPSDLIRH